MQLMQMGAIKNDKDRLRITPLGRQMAMLPLEPSLAKTLLDSVRLGCTREIVDLLAILEQADKVLINTTATREAATEAHSKFVHRTGDHLMLLNVLHTYDDLSGPNKADDDRTSMGVRSWCKDNFVSARAMSNVVATRRQLRQRCDQLAIDWTTSCGEDPEPILRSLLGGQSLRAALRQPDGTLVQLSTKLVRRHALSDESPTG